MKTHLSAPAIAALLLTLACGGSNDGRPAVSTFAHATVDVTGTLTVNGTVYGTRGAVVRYLDDGRVLNLGDGFSGLAFPAGAVVVVRGRLEEGGRTGIAEEVLVRSVLRGPLQGRGESVLAVAGADVLLDAGTVLLDADGGPASIDSLPAGARVEVHGWPESGTRVRATRVSVVPGEPAVSVHGWTLAAPSSGVFDLSLVSGGAPLLRVDAASVSGAPTPANALVRVAGTGITAGAPPLLAATGVNVVAQLLPVGEARAVLEGLIAGGSLPDFRLGEHRVRTTGATQYDGVPADSTPETLALPGVRLVAEGPLEGGALVAERVRFVNALRLDGRIDPGSFAITNPAAAGSFTLAGSIVVVDASTRITSGGAELTLRELVELHGLEAAGLPVSVIGYRRADAAVQAQLVTVSSG
jgi:hypothetical protein